MKTLFILFAFLTIANAFSMQLPPDYCKDGNITYKTSFENIHGNMCAFSSNYCESKDSWYCPILVARPPNCGENGTTLSIVTSHRRIGEYDCPNYSMICVNVNRSYCREKFKELNLNNSIECLNGTLQFKKEYIGFLEINSETGRADTYHCAYNKPVCVSNTGCPSYGIRR